MNDIEKRLNIISNVECEYIEPPIKNLFYEDSESIREIDNCGNNYCHKKYSMAFHRDDGLPAFISWDGDLYWYNHGNKHREHDKPAIILKDGTMEWYYNGQHHRLNNQPAVIRPDGTREYWENGKQIK